MKTVLTLMTFFLLPSITLAHPHVWVYASLELITNPAGDATGVKTHWVFDDLYSSAYIVEADKNGNNQLDPDEIQQTKYAIFERKSRKHLNPSHG